MFNALTTPLILFVPGGNALFALVVWVLLGVNMAAGPFLFRAIMADVADHDAVATHRQRTGLFYALLGSMSKVGAARAIGAGYVVLEWIGFTPQGANTPATLDALRAVYVWPAVIISALVAVFFWFFPLDEAQQRRNRRILEVRQRASFAAPVSPHDPG